MHPSSQGSLGVVWCALLEVRPLEWFGADRVVSREKGRTRNQERRLSLHCSFHPLDLCFYWLTGFCEFLHFSLVNCIARWSIDRDLQSVGITPRVQELHFTLLISSRKAHGWRKPFITPQNKAVPGHDLLWAHINTKSMRMPVAPLSGHRLPSETAPFPSSLHSHSKHTAIPCTFQMSVLKESRDIFLHPAWDLFWQKF